jgi:hypothetical protein
MALGFKPFAHLVARAIQTGARILRWIRFMPADDLGRALIRLDLLRIVLGLLLFARFYPELIAARHHTDPSVQIALASGVLLSGSLAAGIATPLAAIALALGLNLVIDAVVGLYSLGSLIVASCLIPMLITPAGYTCSIDAWLLRRPTWVGVAWRRLYGWWGTPELDRLQVGKALALVTFAVVSLYSAWQHLASPTWRSGAMTAVLLLSPVANPRWAPIAERAYAQVPTAFLVFSRISTYGMLLWQLCLLPLALLSRPTRYFVVVWGVLFFLVSTFLLQLKELGVYEVLLWALIFWNGSVRTRAREFSAQGVSSGRFATALMLCIVVLTAAFVVEWAGINDPLRAQVVHRRAPMVVGVGYVHVFNELDFAMYRHSTTAYEQEPSGQWQPIRFTPTERVDQRLSYFLQQDASVAKFCDPPYAQLWFTSYIATLAATDARRMWPMKMVFSLWTHPTNADFAVMRSTPLAVETTCEVPMPVP